jgi:hypothetical protein
MLIVIVVVACTGVHSLLLWYTYRHTCSSAVPRYIRCGYGL